MMSDKHQVRAEQNPSDIVRVNGLLQRKCACGNHTIAGGECDECGKNHVSLQRATQNAVPENRNGVPPIVHDVLRSPGQPLDASTRAFFEPRFRHDFSRVRVHADAAAAESARAVTALAYTVGTDIAFDVGQYAPSSEKGKKLLAHELTHVVRQQTQEHQGELTISQPSDAHEHEADQMSGAIVGASGSVLRHPRMSERVEPSPGGRLHGVGAHTLLRQAAAVVRKPRVNCALPSGGTTPSCYDCINTATNTVVRMAVLRTPCPGLPKIGSCWEFIAMTGSRIGTAISLVYQDPQTKKGMAVTNMKAGTLETYPDVNTALDFGCSRMD